MRNWIFARAPSPESRIPDISRCLAKGFVAGEPALAGWCAEGEFSATMGADFFVSTTVYNSQSKAAMPTVARIATRLGGNWRFLVGSGRGSDSRERVVLLNGGG